MRASLGYRSSTLKLTALISRWSSTPLQLRASAKDGTLKIQLVRHEEDEVEGVLRVTDRLHTRSKYAGQYAEEGELILADCITSSILFPWLPRASASEDSHSAACLTSPTELHASGRNAT